MKPLILTMQAFGPYAKREEINFERLGHKTMFVISGATGAGKTTIFDGISFAIYGKASGDDRNGPDLRSQFAEDHLQTEVSLLFELKGRTYQIVRSPQQEKKKSRGEGTTLQSAKAELMEVKEENVLLASNVREVDEKIQEIMKIDCHQFRQIMMIPQGEFRKLLISDSKDKEKILQKLFHTEHYKAIEEKLKENAVALKNQVEKYVLQRKTYIDRINYGNNERLGEYVENSGQVNCSELLQELKVHIEENEALLTALEKNISKKDNDRVSLQKQINQAQVIEEQFEAKDRLSQVKIQLEQRKPEIDSLTNTVHQAKKALTIGRYEQQWKDVGNNLDQKDQELQIEKNHLNKLKESLKEARVILVAEQEKNGERLALQKELNDLETLKTDIISYEKHVKNVSELSNKIERLKEEKKQLEEELIKTDQQLEIKAKEKELVSEAKVTYANTAVMLKEEDNFLTRVKQLVEAKGKLFILEERYTSAEAIRNEVHGKSLKANEALQTMLDTWNRGQATLLAKQLVEGDPCPVCGSDHHPNAANTHEDLPSENEMKAFQDKVKKIEIEKGKADVDYYQLKSQFETHMQHLISLTDELKLDLPTELINHSLEELQDHFLKTSLTIKQKLTDLNKKLQMGERIENEIRQLATTKEDIKHQLESCRTTYDTTYTTYIENKRDLTRLSETLPDNLRNERDYQKKSASLHSKLDVLERSLKEAEASVNALNKDVATAEGSILFLQSLISELKQQQQQALHQFEQSLGEMGFTSVEEYRLVSLSQPEIESTEQKIQSFREEYRSVTDRYEDLVQRLANVNKPNILLLHEQLEKLTSEIDLLQEEKNTQYHKNKTNVSIYDDIVAINQNLGEVEERYKVLGELANISSGKNTYRMTFERYVLASFLDQILFAANARLNKMTNGRYQLLRKTDRAKGNAQSGLELLVYDQYTGQSRHVKTLSGGESFKASLSLALGLADIVQSFSGGISLETMFIDEGFGTLDPESLEHAIETLIDIQSTGRLVGIISHVPELKERIDARFEVTSTQSGSTVTFYED